MSRQSHTLCDIGDLMSRSGYIADQVSNGRVSKVRPVSTRYVNERTPVPICRESSIQHWISVNPSADHNDLSDVFFTGTLVAKSYLLKYR